MNFDIAYNSYSDYVAIEEYPPYETLQLHNKKPYEICDLGCKSGIFQKKAQKN